MKKYNKVTDIEVLRKYHEVQGTNYRCGIWLDWISIDLMADILHTSKYQIQKAYKSLTEEGYMKLEKVCTHHEYYYNGLYEEPVPILYTKAYVLTDRARNFFKIEETATKTIIEHVEKCFKNWEDD